MRQSFRSVRRGVVPVVTLAVLSACAGDLVAPSAAVPGGAGPSLAVVPQAPASFQGGCNKQGEEVTAFGFTHTSLANTMLRVTHPNGMDRLRFASDGTGDSFGVCTALGGAFAAHAVLEPVAFPDGGSVSVILKTPTQGFLTAIVRRRADGQMRAIVKYEWDTDADFMVVVTRNGQMFSSASGSGQVGLRLPVTFRLYEWDFNYNAGTYIMRGRDAGGNDVEVRAVVAPKDLQSGFSSGATKFKAMGPAPRFINQFN